MNPKVSIVIPAYNASNYLAEAIDSALAQTYENTEIIVVNDGSKDDGATERVALSYGDRIRYFYKENGGSSSALNYGIANMTGEWFSWLSHDDLYVSEKLEKQICYMNELGLSQSDLSGHVFFSASELIDADGKTVRACDIRRAREISERLQRFPHNGYMIAEPTQYNFHGCSCLVHKCVFETVGCFDEGWRLLNDVDMWFRIYSAGYRIHYIPEPLVKGRIHAKQVSRSIGFSYHNPEQDKFWNRSLTWLKENHPDEYELYFLYGRNAYLKTRDQEGNIAFAVAKTLNTKKKAELTLKKNIYRLRAWTRSIGKKVYMKIKL
jgi:glycosyltransferase involved in cell wall biosynthesis